MRLKGMGTIGKRIRELRKSLGMSQMALAEKIDVSYQQIQKYENGKSAVSVPRLKQLSDALGVPIHSFITAEYGVSDNKRAGFFSDEELKIIRQFRKLKGQSRQGFVKMLDEVAKFNRTNR